MASAARRFVVICMVTLVSLTGFAQSQPIAEQQAEPTGIVQIENGPVRGRISKGMQQFLGIPFAAPPIGALRWRSPQPLTERWSSPRETVAFGGTCPQTLTIGVFAAKSRTEDCLYLNIYGPKKAKPGDKLPVLVWIYGGGLYGGESNDYDGSRLAEVGNVLVVTVNYRANIFGFLALKGLDDEGAPSANYGLMDQQFALQWVKRNIAGFGGDSGNITVAGESSGAQSVLLHIISPAAAGVFQHAILESGSLLPRIVGVAVAQARGEAFVAAAGCVRPTPVLAIACLRALSVEDIQAKAAQFMGVPLLAIDGTIITQTFEQAFRSGSFNHVPVIDGTNKDEFRLSLALEEEAKHAPLTADQYVKRVTNGEGIIPGFGDTAPTMLAAYPLADYASPSAAYGALATDGFYNSACDALDLDAAMSRYAPVYAYFFADEDAPSYFPPASFPMGAYHTSELAYLFPGYHGARGTYHPLSPSQASLSNDMIHYWTAFAKSGNPNGRNTPEWAPYAPETNSGVLILELPAPKTESVKALNASQKCELWASLPANLHTLRR